MSTELTIMYAVGTTFYIAGTIIWLWMLADCFIREPGEGLDKALWLSFIMLSHVVGAVIYLSFRRPKRIKQFGR